MTRRGAATAACTLLALLAAACAALPSPTPETPTPMKKLTPIVLVDAIEPCLPFWTERLGFETTATVPHDDRLGFVILQKGGVELMYQTRASVDADIPGLADGLMGTPSLFFVEVDAIDPLLEALDGVEVVVPRRQTFYGMDEVFVRAPCGTVVGFAAQVEGAEAPAG